MSNERVMGRVAALYDIHGNLPALDAALAAVEARSVDAIVIGGDIVLGPMPRETLDRVRAHGAHARFIRGNCDRLIVDAFDGKALERLPPIVRQQFQWCATELDESDRDFLADLPLTSSLNIEGLGEVLFCHATPRSDEEIFTGITPEDRVRPMLEGVAERVVVCGHTHMQFDRLVAGIRVINAGSVGSPFGAPAAHWLVLGPEAEHVRTSYDLERAAEAISRTAYPQAADFAARHVLRTPDETEALKLYEKAASGA
jgi:putative phosphoesterase